MDDPGVPNRDVFRPFLPTAPRVHHDVGSRQVGDAPSGVRAYLITGGRASAPLAYETILVPKSRVDGSTETFERARIMQVCRSGDALSVAELAARLRLPIGVVRVLASDLVNAGLLSAHSSENTSSDVTLLTRLIHGVRAL